MDRWFVRERVLAELVSNTPMACHRSLRTAGSTVLRAVSLDGALDMPVVLLDVDSGHANEAVVVSVDGGKKLRACSGNRQSPSGVAAVVALLVVGLGHGATEGMGHSNSRCPLLRVLSRWRS